MTHDDVQRWLDRYIEAWRSYDPGQIGELFSEDAEYRYRPYGDPVRGRAEIVRSWVTPEGAESELDAPDSWSAQYEPFAVDGHRAVAIGWSRYLATDDEPAKLYHNCYLLQFDDDGRCSRFTEFFMLAKKADG
jgi:hypothetical protein